MTRLLLTGAGGSIGCHTLIHFLHNTDWHITCVDSFRHRGLTDRITHMLRCHPEYRNRVSVFTHDLRAPISEMLTRQMGDQDIIVAMASLPNVWESIQTPAPFITDNVAIALTMLEYARVVKPRAFMQISTDEVYGPTDGIEYHSEWDPIVPSNPYSASKVAQEAAATSYWRTYGLPLIIVNLMNNFGEMQASDKFPAICQRLLREGKPITIHGTPETIGTRYYIHSRNSASAFLYMLQNTTPHMHQEGGVDKPDRYNIVGDRRVSNIELAELIAEYSGYPLRYEFEDFTVTRPGHDRHYGLDGSKLAALGWRQPVPFEESLRNTVQWYEENPQWLYPQ